MPRLLLKKKAEIISDYEIKKDMLSIGSSRENDICLSEQSISTHHCDIYRENDTYYVKDNTSAFGTFINKTRVAIRALEKGDHIFIGTSPFSMVFVPDSNEADAKAARAGMHVLIGIQGKFSGKMFEILPGETRIGRDEDYNDIVLPGSKDPSVSRRHSTIHYADNVISISDRRSRNRTFVNQREIGENDTVPLAIDDEIVIGHTIFRFCSYQKLNYTHPRKSSTTFERFKIPLFNAATFLLVVGGLIYFFLNVKSFMVMSNVPEAPAIKRSAWSPQILDTDPQLGEPLTYGITPSPASGNVLGLGMNEIVYAFPYGTIYVWDGDKGTVQWKEPKNLSTTIGSSSTLYDLNHDGALDVILAAGDSRVYLFDGKSGVLLYKSELLGGTINSEPVIGDINRDGIEDIVACSEEGIIHIIYNPLAGVDIKQLKVDGKIFAPPVIFKNAADTMFIVGTTNGKMYFYDGISLEPKTINTAESINKYTGSHLPINEITSTPAVGDINEDGVLEAVIFSNQYYVCAFNIGTRELEWIYHVEPPSLKESPHCFSSPLLADLNRDGTPDVIVTAPNGKVIAIQGQDGALLWEYNTGDWNRIISSPGLADIDKDGTYDVIFGSEDGTLFVLSGNTALESTAERLLIKEKEENVPITSTPCVGDFNDDGYVDILISYANNMLRMFNTNTRVLKGLLYFPMKNVDAAHSGLFVFPNLKKIILYKLLGSFMVFFIMIVAQYMRHTMSKKNRPQVIVLE